MITDSMIRAAHMALLGRPLTDQSIRQALVAAERAAWTKPGSKADGNCLLVVNSFRKTGRKESVWSEWGDPAVMSWSFPQDNENIRYRVRPLPEFPVES